MLVTCAVLLIDFQGRLLSFTASLGLDRLTGTIEVTISIFAWVAGGWLVSGLIHTLVWPRVEKRLGYPPPEAAAEYYHLGNHPDHCHGDFRLCPERAHLWSGGRLQRGGRGHSAWP